MVTAIAAPCCGGSNERSNRRSATPVPARANTANHQVGPNECGRRAIAHDIAKPPMGNIVKIAAQKHSPKI
jgi:hypothetical protein